MYNPNKAPISKQQKDYITANYKRMAYTEMGANIGLSKNEVMDLIVEMQLPYKRNNKPRTPREKTKPGCFNVDHYAKELFAI